MGFLQDYSKYVELNEAHENYHSWAALSAIAALATRKVWLTRAYHKVYPNLYVVLVGPQGNRKTAAKDIAQHLLRKVGGVEFSSEATTREALIKEMEATEQTFMYNNIVETYKAMMICVTEFKEFLTIDPGRMLNFLTAVYDQDFFDYSTAGKGKQRLTNPCVNMLACETPDWLTERLKDKIVSGGFSRRVVYVYETEHKRIVVKFLPPEIKQAYERCIVHAKRIQRATGEFKWDAGAEEFYDDWYLTFSIPEKKPAMKGYYDSKHTLLMKLAMLVSLSEGNTMKVSVPHLQVALAYLETVEKNMNKVFVGGGRNELGLITEKANDHMVKLGRPIPEKELKVFLFHDCKNVSEQEHCLTQLIDSGRLFRWLDGTRTMVCSMGCLPSDVEERLRAASSLQSSKPVDGKVSGSVSSGGPSTAPSSTQLDSLRQLRESPRTSPAASDEDTEKPH